MNPKSILIALFLLAISCNLLQASIFPIPLSQRISESSQIVLASLESQHAFRSEADQQIYTLNVLHITAYLKGMRGEERLGLISIGGNLEDEGQITYPSVRLQKGKQYALFLEPDPLGHSHPAFPELLQLRAYASVQGALPLEGGFYQDLLYDAFAERYLLQKVFEKTGEAPLRADGKAYQLQAYTSSTSASRMLAISSVSSVSATGIAAGTIDAGRVLSIQGMGFDPFLIGATGSSVEFSSAWDGGISFIGLDDKDTDILLWSDTEIRVKIPGDAGTGLVRLNIFANGSVTHPITVDWAVIPKYSIHQSWTDTMRQRLELVKAGSVNNDGYAFQFDNTYWTNLPAVNAFLNAVQTWRCNTFINLSFETSPNNAVYVSGSGSQVRFASSATLGAGVLAQAHLRFRNTFSALLPSCIQQNTLWYVTDMDILFVDNPAPFSWNFGPNPTPANSYDFESVALKMVGLASGLGYINQSGTALYFSLPDGQDIRNLSANEIVAGTHKVTHSVTVTACKTQLAGNGLMVAIPGAQDCVLDLYPPVGGPDSWVEKPFVLQLDKTKNQLLVEWKSRSISSLGLTLLDLQGRRVFQEAWIQEGEGIRGLDISGLAEGIYVFRLVAGEDSWHGKFFR